MNFADEILLKLLSLSLSAMAELSISEMEKPIHLLVFPYPAQGHNRPLLDLTHRLALRPEFTVTVITTPKNLSSLSSLISAHPSTVHPLVLPFPSHPALPDGVENVRDIGNRGNLPIMSALRSLRRPIAEWFRSNPDPPVAIISDFFLGWTYLLAVEDLGIPRFAFFGVGAFLASILDHCFLNYAAVAALEVVPFTDLPNSPSFKEEHLPSLFRLYSESDGHWEHIKDGMVANTSSYGCIFNSFECLEGPYMEHLKRKIGHDRVYGVGPLSLVGLDSGPSRYDPCDTVFQWLDGCPDRSVLYVCFGSQKALNMDQMEALASGLEKSGVRFIWVVYMGSAQKRDDGLGPLLEEFEARVGGRGMVLRGWAPQVAILGHRAVGGFLTHCGWNSLMEAVVAGVVLLAWPMEADQFVNAKLLVEDIGAAVRVCEGADAVPEAENLSQVIAGSMRGDTKEKAEAKKLHKKALAAVAPGGSSANVFDCLVGKLLRLARGKNND
ncbi:hypothetical protein SAY86_002127 [Trapa natans]|uniref:Uncharacterized protein n=1 Tax=Trapa natans TaxID=22666 RepID=A0AAN7LPC5_TRANT|nr:hypothetical protein SAY86_002127 [Trapa natans]